MKYSEEYDVRLKKLEDYESVGASAFPALNHRTHMTAEAIASFDQLFEEKNIITLAGRVRQLRKHGGSIFAVLEDGSGRMQLYFRKDHLSMESFSLVQDTLDLGDIIQITGTVFITKTGEKTLDATSVSLLAKALMPPPDEWYGVNDIETRYRHRELDLLANEDVRKRFIIRSKLISALRHFLDEQDFIEVETPMLQPIPGGANARPFITHHNALDIDLYLRIAQELYLKRLIIGGYEKVYEIGRLFRNEGIDHAHNPEFTTIELYWAFVPTKDFFVDFLERIMREIIQKAIGTLTVPYGDSSIDFGGEWKRTTFREAVLDSTGIDIDKHRTKESLITATKEKGLKIDFSKCVGIGEHYDQLYKKTARDAMHEPTWVFDYPVELKPLAKASPDDPTKSASVQLLIEGLEIINAYYHELNNPVDQRERFMQQEALRQEGSTEAQFLDEDFLFALEHGMPPTSGMGMGIDRLVALLTNSKSLKEIILFPTLRPKDQKVLEQE